MPAEGCAHVQVKSDSYVNTDVLPSVWGIPCPITQPGTHNAASGATAAAEQRQLPSGDKRIRENINSFEKLRLPKPRTLKDSTGSNWRLKNTRGYHAEQQAAFALRCWLGSRSSGQLGLPARARVSSDGSACGWPCRALRPGDEGWPCLTSCPGCPAQLCPGKLLLRCRGCRQQLQGVWFARFGAESFRSWRKTC